MDRNTAIVLFILFFEIELSWCLIIVNTKMKSLIVYSPKPILNSNLTFFCVPQNHLFVRICQILKSIVSPVSCLGWGTLLVWHTHYCFWMFWMSPILGNFCLCNIIYWVVPHVYKPADFQKFTRLIVSPKPSSSPATPPSLPLLEKLKGRPPTLGSPSFPLSTWPALCPSSLR